MKNIKIPDAITTAACRWILSGEIRGAYDGPDPPVTHGLAPVLSKETGRKDVSLSMAADWIRREHIVKPVLERISEQGFAVWAIKGFDLARSVYSFPGGRPMSDVDLFIKKEDIHKVLAVFDLCGWSGKSPGSNIFSAGIVSEIKMCRQDTMAELHTHIFYFPATFPGKLPSDLFENGRSLEPGLIGFAWHNALLMVVLHMMTNIDLRPVWWVDICLLCKKVTEARTWDVFSRNAHATKLNNQIVSILSIADEVLGAPIPGNVVDVLGKSDSGRGYIVDKLKIGRRIPTLLNLKHLVGWKKISWFFALLWLVFTGQRPMRKL